MRERLRLYLRLNWYADTFPPTTARKRGRRQIPESEYREKTIMAGPWMLEAHGLIGSGQRRRAATLAEVLSAHPDAALAFCGDERTGQRFGLAQKRSGRCRKIGRTTYRHQVWAVWAGEGDDE